MPTLNLAITISTQTQTDLLTSWKRHTASSLGTLAVASTTGATQTLTLAAPTTLTQGTCLLAGGQVYQVTAAVNASVSVPVSSNVYGTGNAVLAIGAAVLVLSYPDPFTDVAESYFQQALNAMSQSLGAASAIFGTPTVSGSFS